MATCQHCHEQWTYMDTLKSMFRLKCRYCHQKNFHSAKSRKRDIIYSLIPVPIILFSSLIDIPFIWVIVIGIIMIAAFISIYPLFLQLSKEEEPLW